MLNEKNWRQLVILFIYFYNGKCYFFWDANIKLKTHTQMRGNLWMRNKGSDGRDLAWSLNCELALLVEYWRNIRKCSAGIGIWWSVVCSVFCFTSRYVLTLYLLNFLNGIIHLPFMELSIIIFRNSKMKTFLWYTNH